MWDDRTALARDMLVESEDHRTYRILEETGRGSGCIVYNASYTDTSGHQHLVRLKECYPYDLGVWRTEDGGLRAPAAACRAFEEERKKFEAAYIKGVNLKITLGLINSTMDAVDLFFSNHTWYSVMTCVEGMDYRQDLDEDLRSLFIRILTLARIVKKYHDHGILCLDIKPENMFLIPETKEHMVLFDFDSLIEKEELKHGRGVRISFSDGYGAPELVQGRRDRICEAADIYSIGAVVFYKVFGRTPNAMDGAAGTTYDFSLMKKPDGRYQPELFRELRGFFHKTLGASVSGRYKSIDHMIPVLERLVRISDIDQVFLYHNFSYNFASFVGREKELREMEEVFDSGHQILFLWGTGGIGKTELAKRYAYENAGKYRKIVFLPFEDSLGETFCKDDLRIHGVEQEEGESGEQYFERKLSVLKTLVSPEDLIILDNFDVEQEDHLETVLECPCKFLVTSREDFRDYDYRQINVGPMEDMETLFRLFQACHPQVNDRKEQEQIKDIIELVDRHTMTVGLIAKYLRTTGVQPGDLLNKLMETAGITTTEEIHIRHRKDRKLRAESINNHLLALFDLWGFSAGQEEVMRSLSLLGHVRITKTRFHQYCMIPAYEEELESLIRRGWVEYDRMSEKISLHSLILDLVYNYMEPCGENCPHIVAAMTGYLKEYPASHVERQGRKKLAKDFIRRVRGRDLAYARLCVTYCENIARKPEYLELAEEICLLDPDREAKDLLQRICRVKMQLAGSGQDILMRMMEEEDSFDEEAYWEERSIEICRLAKKAYTLAVEYSEDPGYLGSFCVDVAWELDGILTDNLSLMVQEGRKPFLDRILDRAAALLEEGKAYLLKGEMDPDKKRELFHRIQKFYDPDDFTAMYRCEYYGNGDYYLKAWEEETEPYETALHEAARIYQKQGDEKMAVSCLERVLETDREKGQKLGKEPIYTNSVCCELIDLLMGAGRFEEARVYGKEMVDYNIGHVEDRENAWHLKWLAAAYYRLYKMEPPGKEKQDFWEAAARYFSMLSEEETLPEELVEFLVRLADQEEEDTGKMQRAFEYRQRAEDSSSLKNTIPFLDYILGLCGNKPEYIRYQMMACICYSGDLLQACSGREDEALAYALRARDCLETQTPVRKLHEEPEMEDVYLENLIQKTIGQCCAVSDQYGYDQVREAMEKCNYLLLAEHDARGKTEEKQMEIWAEAADRYNYIENYVMEEICYDKLFGIFDPILHKDPYSSMDAYWDAASGQISCYIRLEKRQKAWDRIMDIYHKLLDYYKKQDQEKVIRRNARQFGSRLVTCADRLMETGREKEAFWIYVMAIPASVNGRIVKAWQYRESQREVWSGVCDVLHGSLTGRQVDDVAAVYEKVKPVLERHPDLEEFHKEFQWFWEKYQKVTFKR